MNLFFRISFIIVFATCAQGAMSFYNTSDYRGRLDNPFLSDVGSGITYVEDFENQGTLLPRNLLTTPYATGWNGVSAGTAGFWGVQEDNSGVEPAGRTWSYNGRSPDATKPPDGIHFDFTPDPQGSLPEYAGAALLGRFDPNGTNTLYNSIFVYDKEGLEVTEGEWKFVRPPFSAIPSDPADYFLNFYGIYVPGGISRIHFVGFDEVDHLTYGYTAIPEPSAQLLGGGAVLALALRRRRR